MLRTPSSTKTIEFGVFSVKYWIHFKKYLCSLSKLSYFFLLSDRTSSPYRYLSTTNIDQICPFWAVLKPPPPWKSVPINDHAVFLPSAILPSTPTFPETYLSILRCTILFGLSLFAWHDNLNFFVLPTFAKGQSMTFFWIECSSAHWLHYFQYPTAWPASPIGIGPVQQHHLPQLCGNLM